MFSLESTCKHHKTLCPGERYNGTIQKVNDSMDVHVRRDTNMNIQPLVVRATKPPLIMTNSTAINNSS